MNISTVAFCCIVFFFFFPRIVTCLICFGFFFPLAVRTIPHEHRLKKQQQQQKKNSVVPARHPQPSPPTLYPPCPAPSSDPASSIVQQSRNLEIALKVAMNQTDYLTADSFQFSIIHFVLLLFVYFTWKKKRISVML